MAVKLLPYKSSSESAKLLAESLGIKRLKKNGTWTPKDGDKIINWGSTRLPDRLDVQGIEILNDPFFLSDITNKLSFFQAMPREIVPEWTDDPGIASVWLIEGHTVVCRHNLTGHSGQGIELVSDPSETIPNVPLYTKYFKKTEEYRVHVFRSEVIDVQQKKRRLDVPDGDVDWKIRNLKGGFIYARNEIEVPEIVTSVALRSFEFLNLDFAAFDVCFNKYSGKAVTLEANSAPGVQGSTLDAYVNSFKKVIEGT